MEAFEPSIFEVHYFVKTTFGFYQEKKHQSITHSPKTTTSGFSIPAHSMTSEIVSTKDSVPNRWYRPDTDAPSSIRSIQIEERAIKDLKRFYSSVKLVKPQTN